MKTIPSTDTKALTSSKHYKATFQFNSKSSQLIFPQGPSRHVNNYNNCSYIYTKRHRFIGQTQANTTYTFIQKHIHKHSYNVYTNMYIHRTLSFMHRKEQYLVNNKHVEQEGS